MNNHTSKSTAWTRAITVAAAIAIAAMLSSCAHLNPPEPTPEPAPAVVEKKPPPAPIKPPPPSPLYEWWGKDYVSHIEVSINEQKARFYEGDQMVGWTTVASGIHKFPTPTGKFAITEKVQEKKSNLYGKIYNKSGKLVKRNAKMGVHKVPAGGRFKGAPMPYFMRLTNDGIGMHAGPIPRPGNRASHGCIRMPRNFAPILYRHVDIGTPVTIKGNGPTYASYTTKRRKSTRKPTAVAVAKATPPANDVSPAVAAVAAEQSVPAQSVTDVSASGGSTAVSQQPTVAGATEAPGVAPARATAVSPSNPATSATPSATDTGADSAPTTPAPAMPAAPASTLVVTTPPPSPPPSMDPNPVATAPSASTPTTVVTPVPTAPQAPSPAPQAPPSMTGAPATSAPPTSQTTTPVVPVQQPAATGPTAQAEG